MKTPKYLLIVLLYSFSFSGCADSGSKLKTIYDEVYKKNHPSVTGKLSITGEENNIWLKFYQLTINRGSENIIPLIAKFDLDHVRSVMIIDENAEKAICDKKQQVALLLLNFNNPDKNIKQIKTYINKPCFDGNKARFKLIVETSEGDYYTNTSTLSATENAFGTIYHANYDEKRKPYIPKNIKSEKISLASIKLEESPDTWLVVEEYSYPGKITTTPIMISFNVKNIQTIKIDDIHAYNYKCGANNPINLLNLKFEKQNMSNSQIITEIPTPCLYHDKTKLQLSIKAKDGTKYYKVITLPRKAVNY